MTRLTPAPVLLVHGAFHGAWCWDRLAPALAERDVKAHAVDLPFTSIADDAETVASAIDRANGPVVVVGHSYGGLVITAGAGAATHLVYLAALMTDADDAVDLTVTPAMTAVRTSDGMSYFDPDQATTALYHRCRPEIAEWAASKLRPMSARKAAASPSGVAWRTVPSTYVLCSDDRAIHPDDQRRMAARATTCVELDSDHSPFLCVVEDLADVLAHVAGAAGVEQ